MPPFVSPEFILIVARAAALALAFLTLAWAFRRWRRDLARDTQRVFEQLDLIRADLRELADQIQVAKRDEVRQEAQDTAARFALTPPHTGPRGYEVAVRLAKSGATREELISNCGISRHEAELLLRLHGAQAGAKTAHAEPGAAAASPEAPPQPSALPRPRLAVVG